MSLYESRCEPYIIRGLAEMLVEGKTMRANDLGYLRGEVYDCLEAIQQDLLAHGGTVAWQVFNDLKASRPWLERLTGMPYPGMLPDLPERRIRFRPDEAFENRPPRQWLIAEILPKESIALVFGPPACGKSFLTMGWSMCIGTGTPWLERAVEQGPVAYIAAEGGAGIGARSRAWKVAHHWQGNSGVSGLRSRWSCTTPSTWTSCAPRFCKISSSRPCWSCSTP